MSMVRHIIPALQHLQLLSSAVEIYLGNRLPCVDGHRYSESPDTYILTPKVRPDVQNHSAVSNPYNCDDGEIQTSDYDRCVCWDEYWGKELRDGQTGK